MALMTPEQSTAWMERRRNECRDERQRYWADQLVSWPLLSLEFNHGPTPDRPEQRR